MHTANGFAVLFLICTPVYILYMKIVHIFLLRKEGEKWWKTLIPFYGKYLIFKMGDREQWYPFYIICMTLFYLLGVIGVLGLASTIEGIQNKSMSGTMTSIFMKESYNFLEWAIACLFLSFLARFHLAGGMTTRFGMKGDRDYCFGFVVFPFAFQAEMAFSRKMELGPHQKKEKKKKKKLSLPHFF